MILLAEIFIITLSIFGTAFVSANLDNYIINFQDKYDMIIISTEEFKTSLETFIEHKVSLGINTIFIPRLTLCSINVSR